MKRIALLALTLTCWLGCGGENSSPIEFSAGGTTGNGTGGGNGTASGAMGAKEGAMGAASLVVQNSVSASAGYSCGAAHTLIWGQLDAAGFPSPTGALVEGQLGASVRCNLSGEESYAVSAQLATGSSHVDIEGSVDSTSGAGTARVSIFDSYLALSLADPSCTLQITGYAVTSAGFAASVSCNHLSSNDDINLWCALSGAIAFDGCGQ